MTVAEYAAVAQVLATVISVFALVGLVGQLRVSANAADLQALSEFVRAMHSAERKVRDAPDYVSPIGEATDKDAIRRWAIYELFDLIEVNAAAERGGLFPATSKAMVVGKLKTSITVFDQKYRELLEYEINNNNAYQEIEEFKKRHMDEKELSSYLRGMGGRASE